MVDRVAPGRETAFGPFVPVPRDPNPVGVAPVLQSIPFDETPSAAVGITNTRVVTITP